MDLIGAQPFWNTAALPQEDAVLQPASTEELGEILQRKALAKSSEREIGCTVTYRPSRPCFSGEQSNKQLRAKQLRVSPSMTGLQFKSLVLAELALEGGFQHYVMTCGGDPFASRVALSNLEAFAEGCEVVVEDIGSRPKPEGRT